MSPGTKYGMNCFLEAGNCPWEMTGSFLRTKRVKANRKGEGDCPCTYTSAFPETTARQYPALRDIMKRCKLVTVQPYSSNPLCHSYFSLRQSAICFKQKQNNYVSELPVVFISVRSAWLNCTKIV